MTVNLANAFLGLAYRWPDRIAVDAPEERMTFLQLARRADLLARLLEREGAGAGDRIGIALMRSDEVLIAVLATWFIDATALIIDFRARANERSKLASALGVRMFLEDRPAPGTETYPSFRLPPAWHETVAFAGLPDRVPHAAGDAVAIIGVSSGTTGMPQPVALSHSCLFARYAIARSSPQWRAGGRFLVTTPLAFSATRKHVLSRLLDGDTVIFVPPLNDAAEIAERALKSEATSMLTVPAIARGLLDIAPASAPLFPGMDWMMCCGAPMLPQEKIDARDRLSRGFVQNYGSTMAGMITLLETADVGAHAHTVGRPLPHVLVEILDSQDRVLPAGEPGQIRVRTPGAGAELALPGNVSKRESDLIIDGWIYPGDLAVLDAEGFLSIVGRLSDIIIRGGVNIYPAEVEEVLTAHPAVAEAAVVGWPDRIVGEELAAFVVVKTQASPQELLAWCRSRLGPDKQPREIFLILAMPRNANGKLVRRDLVAQLPKR
jgi:acyl-CoA synthetase (AMP-forming)/AMP-acid ligase II